MKHIFKRSVGKHERPGAKKPFRVLPVVLIAALLFSLGVPVFAAALEPGTPKREVVYIDLASDGAVRGVYVVNSFDLDKDGQIVDYGDYTALRNMTTADDIVFENETVRIDAKAGKLYYEGTLADSSIPWRFSIRYFLDGTELTADELAGRSGALRIELSVRQDPERGGSFFENYSLQATVTLDTALCANIAADGATQASAGADRLLNYTILAGTEKDYVITADVTDFRMDGITINGLPLELDVDVDTQNSAVLSEELTSLEDAVAALDDGANEVKDGASEVRDGADELADGAQTLEAGAETLAGGTADLQSGAQALLDAADELSGGAGELTTGASELKTGAQALLDAADELNAGIDEAAAGALGVRDGALGLQAGADELSGKASELALGLGTLAGKNASLLSGAYSVFTQLTAQAQQSLNAALTAAGQDAVTLTPETYDAVISGLLDTLSGGAYSQAEAAAAQSLRPAAEAEAAAALEAAIRADESVMEQLGAAAETAFGAQLDSLAQSAAALEYAKTASPDDPEGYLASDEGQAACAAYLASEDGQAAAAQLRAAAKAQYVDAAVTEQAQARLTDADIQAGIDDAVALALAGDEAQSRIAAAVETALGGNAAYQSILSVKQTLDGYGAFYGGLQGYTAGVGDAADGALGLSDGAGELSDGAQELSDGAQELYDGLLELQDGGAELRAGVLELRDGSVELYGGVLELADGTTSLVSGAAELRDGTLSLYDGMLESKNGTVELLDGAIALRDGTVSLYDGVIELTDGTLEFRDKTASLDADLKDKINAAIRELLGGDFDVTSFASDKNDGVQSVQFVIRADGVGVEAVAAAQVEPAAPLTFWQKLARLFAGE